VGVGPEQGGRVPVLSGLAAGDDVVVAGAYTLRGEHEREAMEGD
jgi:hypothetical protein